MAKSSIYAIQVASGQEEHVRDLALNLLSDVIEDCFVPTYEAKKNYRGEWRVVSCHLLPGYIFVQTRDPATLLTRLASVPAFTRLLGTSGDSFTHLTDDEVAWLNAFSDMQTHVVHMSEGVIEGDKVIVTKGPLMGHEAQIAKVNRHKRIAVLEIRMFGRTKQVKVGLEIVRKRT